MGSQVMRGRSLWGVWCGILFISVITCISIAVVWTSRTAGRRATPRVCYISTRVISRDDDMSAYGFHIQSMNLQNVWCPTWPDVLKSLSGERGCTITILQWPSTAVGTVFKQRLRTLISQAGANSEYVLVSGDGYIDPARDVVCVCLEARSVSFESELFFVGTKYIGKGEDAVAFLPEACSNEFSKRKVLVALGETILRSDGERQARAFYSSAFSEFGEIVFCSVECTRK
jgi:hypothetical protein